MIVSVQLKMVTVVQFSCFTNDFFEFRTPEICATFLMQKCSQMAIGHCHKSLGFKVAKFMGSTLAILYSHQMHRIYALCTGCMLCVGYIVVCCAYDILQGFFHHEWCNSCYVRFQMTIHC